MSIFPLEQYEADLAEADRAAYERLKPPTSIVVRFGRMRLIGEFPYRGDATPGCGSKIVVKTFRGHEIGEMLTSTCPNAGCTKSVTRQEMLEYIENSGGRDYPFYTDGRALRVATVEDLQKQSAIDAQREESLRIARGEAQELGLPMKLVEADPILGGETLTFYFTAEDRVDFRELVRRLAGHFRTRIELRQVGARDEARLVADYERCGQHCCCRQFLKVLKPVSMRSAKVQRSTLDPLKISGRCGRLMCCLRYEDETYESLRKKLPRRGKRVGTPEGPGRVVDSQILTQLVLVELEAEQRRVAVPVEELGDPDQPMPEKKAAPDPMRGLSEGAAEERTDENKRKRKRGRRRKKSKGEQQDEYRKRSEEEGKKPEDGGQAKPERKAQEGDGKSDGGKKKKRRRRRRRRRGGGGGSGGDGGGGDGGGGGGAGGSGGGSDG